MSLMHPLLMYGGPLRIINEIEMNNELDNWKRDKYRKKITGVSC